MKGLQLFLLALGLVVAGIAIYQINSPWLTLGAAILIIVIASLNLLDDSSEGS